MLYASIIFGKLKQKKGIKVKGKIQTTTVLLHNENPHNGNLARCVAKKKELNPDTVQVEDWEHVSVSNYQAPVYCGPNVPSTGPMPQRDIIVKVKYRVIGGKAKK